jgi:hypothetical protein
MFGNTGIAGVLNREGTVLSSGTGLNAGVRLPVGWNYRNGGLAEVPERTMVGMMWLQ